MRESNSHQRFWRPLSYHLTNPLNVVIIAYVGIIHVKPEVVKQYYLSGFWILKRIEKKYLGKAVTSYYNYKRKLVTAYGRSIE